MATQTIERSVIVNLEQHRRVWGLFSSILSASLKDRVLKDRELARPNRRESVEYRNYLTQIIGTGNI
jgi:hypothetical protein